MSCQKIDPRDFHGPEASQYTERCLEELANSETFNSYVRHIEYKERLFLTWFLVPIGLVTVFYYHVISFHEDYITPFTSKDARSTIGNVPGMWIASLFMLTLLVPWSVTAPFSGFFEDPTRLQSLAMFVLLTAVNVAVASFGGEYYDSPPFLNTNPTVLPLFRDVHGLLKVLLVRVMPMQGFLMAGYALSESRRGFWRRAWHLPFPLITIPMLVCVWGVLWWRAVSLTIPYFFTVDGAPTNVANASSMQRLMSDPDDVVSLWGTVAKEVGVALWDDIQGLWASGLDASFLKGSSGVALYFSLLSMCLTYFFFLLAKPVVEFTMAGFFVLLPTHPTVWGLTMASSVAAIVVLSSMPAISMYYSVALGGLIAALLYNGFVA